MTDQLPEDARKLLANVANSSSYYADDAFGLLHRYASRSQPEPAWRVGTHYGIHVYAGDVPVATFLTAADAKRAVEAVNGRRVHPPQFAGYARTLNNIAGDLEATTSGAERTVAELRRIAADLAGDNDG